MVLVIVIAVIAAWIWLMVALAKVEDLTDAKDCWRA